MTSNIYIYDGLATDETVLKDESGREQNQKE